MTILRFFFALLVVLLLHINGYSQFNTPTINGSIGTSEYGTHTDGQNQQGNGTQTWYMTWDNTNLYIGITTANTGEGAVVYIDKDPLNPINGGSNSDGTLAGFNYDGTSFAALQFRADLVLYVKNGYREYRTADGSNGWSSATTSFGSYADNGSNLREFSIPWSVIGGRPSSFAWFGYITSSGGFVYGQMPTENSGGTIGTSARYARYYIVNSTADGSSTKPFSRESYVFNSTSDITGFGATTVYDFTMNSSGRSLTRAADGSTWTINGGLTVNAGTISFGSSTGTATVSGNVTIGSGGTLTLSSSIGGDLNLGGNWSNNGTFNASSRAVGFNGSSAQSLIGATTFDYLSLNNSAGLTLNNNISVNQTLTFTNGKITLGTNKLTLGSSATISGASSTKYIVTDNTGTVERPISASTSFLFPVGPSGSAYNPLTIALDGTGGATFNVRVQSSVNPAAPDNTLALQRTWNIDKGAGSVQATLTFQWLAAEHGSNFSALNGQGVFRHNGSVYEQVTTIGSLAGDGTSTPYTASTVGTISTFSPFIIGQAGGLPVQLASFTGSYISASSVRLRWRTVSEQNNYGFYVERRHTHVTEWTELQGSFIPGRGTTSIPQEYSYTDNSAPGGPLSYRLRQVDLDGSVQYSDPIIVTSPTSVTETAPLRFALLQNYPNPFNPSTSIKFSVEQTDRATLTVYDALGQHVATLFDGIAEVGQYYQIRFIAENLSSGVYFYRLESGKQSDMRKLLLLR